MKESVLVFLFLIAFCTSLGAFPEKGKVAELQQSIRNLPVGERIAFWAEEFISTPYDPDPIGEYVSKQAIVADDRVDCMYLTFRTIELALSATPEDAVQRALEIRFKTQGVITPQGRVLNYDDRYQYGEDMVFSGKFGKDITSALGSTQEIKGSRGIERVNILPKTEIPSAIRHLQSGDIVFFVKDPAKRAMDEIVGHIGIIKKEGQTAYLIHASGSKGRADGQVKKVSFEDYVGQMRFLGIIVTRL